MFPALKTWLARWDRNRVLAIDIIRVLVGTLLFFQGLHFLGNRQSLMSLLGASGFDYGAGLAAHYVVFAHIVFGATLAIGFATRFSALVQLPALFGAIAFVHARTREAFTTSTTLGLVLLIAAVTVLIVLMGPGKLSLDHYLKAHPADYEEAYPGHHVP